MLDYRGTRPLTREEISARRRALPKPNNPFPWFIVPLALIVLACVVWAFGGPWFIPVRIVG